MNTRRFAACFLAVLAMGAGGCGISSPHYAAEPSSTQAAPVVAPAVRQAVDQLASDNPDDRAEALRRMIAGINQHAAEVAYVMQITALIQRNIAAQIHELALVQDPEARQRIAAVMAFNEALSHFAIDMLALPPEQRQAMLAWGLDPKNAEIVGACWADDADSRVRGVREVAAMPGAEAQRTLARLIDDDDRAVALAAMDAAADCKPSEALVDALWKRAIEYPMRQNGMNMGFVPGIGQMGAWQSVITTPQIQPRMLTLHGRVVQVNPTDSSYLRAQDGGFATEVLADYNSPLVAAKLDALFAALADTPADPNGSRLRVLSPNYGATSACLLRLVNVYKPKAFVPCVLALAAGPVSDGYTQQINNQFYRFGSRADALGILVLFTGQSKEDYGLTRMAPWGNRWMIIGTEQQEEAAVKKMRAWWTEHYKEYGAKDAALPVAGPVNEGFERQGRGVIMINGGVLIAH